MLDVDRSGINDKRDVDRSGIKDKRIDRQQILELRACTKNSVNVNNGQRFDILFFYLKRKLAGRFRFYYVADCISTRVLKYRLVGAMLMRTFFSRFTRFFTHDHSVTAFPRNFFSQIAVGEASLW